jgi:hypothetical protein
VLSTAFRWPWLTKTNWSTRRNYTPVSLILSSINILSDYFGFGAKKSNAKSPRAELRFPCFRQLSLSEAARDSIRRA